ncbi:MAG: RNA repair transcriptional activator RtcR [Planctomycetota bacterium]
MASSKRTRPTAPVPDPQGHGAGSRARAREAALDGPKGNAGPRPVVVIGLLGTQLDAGPPETRWDKWRPTVSLFQRDDLEPARLVLLAEPRFGKLADAVTQDVLSVSPATKVERVPTTFENAWDFAEVYATLADFARDYPFDPEREDYLVHITTGTHVAQICLFLPVETRRIPGRLVQTSPPRREPRRGKGPSGSDAHGTYSIIDLDLSRYDQLAARFEAERREGVDFLKAGIATKNPAFNALMDRIELVAGRSREPLLLTGPTGVGKTALARRVFELRKRLRLVDGAFVEVNCATLRGDQAMSTLFGHEKGAFTGALASRPGLLRAAENGLLFLDEIGELGLDEQAMLLRAIEEGTFLPLGADAPATSRFQLVSGTNKDLAKAVREGTFREDLLARIDLWTFELPALRERPEDLEPNLDHELARLSEARGQRVTFASEARAAFLDFARSPEASWRANFRDFNAALARLATLADGGRITRALVTEERARLVHAWARLAEPGATASGASAYPNVDAHLPHSSIDLFDRAQLEAVLRVCLTARTLSEAGRDLFAVSRAAKSSSNDADRLRKYLARFGLSFESIAETAQR